MADDGEKIDVEQLEKMEGGIPELARRTSQPYDYSEKQLGEKTHVPTVESMRTGDAGEKKTGCGKPGCKCQHCECGPSCKCGEAGQGDKLNEGGAKQKGCGKPGCKCDDCKCGSSCKC